MCDNTINPDGAVRPDGWPLDCRFSCWQRTIWTLRVDTRLKVYRAWQFAPFVVV